MVNDDARLRIPPGSAAERAAACSRAVVHGSRVLVSGTLGVDESTMTIDADPVAQARRALANVAATLAGAGCTLDDVIRVRYLLTDAALFERLAPVFGEAFARSRPAATAMVAGLIDPRAKVAIEVEAALPPAPQRDWGPQPGV